MFAVFKVPREAGAARTETERRRGRENQRETKLPERNGEEKRKEWKGMWNLKVQRSYT